MREKEGKMKFRTFVAAIVLAAVLVTAPTQALGLTPSTQSTTAQRNAIAHNWTYYTRGYYQNNCLAYALGNTTQWIWPWPAEPMLGQVAAYLIGLGWTWVGPDASGPLKTTRIYCYGSSDDVLHFAKCVTPTSSVQNDTVRAKWGHFEVFTHSNAHPYNSPPDGYGGLVGVWVK